MKQVLPKIGVLSLFCICCVFLLSEAKVSSKVFYPEDSFGKHALQSAVNLDQYYDGEVNFETILETDRNNHTRSILKLKLVCKDNGFDDSIEFLISKENTTKQISQGSYLVSKDSRGFLRNFDGVFAFANINSLGELPFFAKSGEVRIDFADDSTVKGTVNVNLRNANGKSINLEGDFVALK